MKTRLVEIEHLDAEDLVDLIVERLSERMNLPSQVNTNNPCLPCEERWLTSAEILNALQISRPTLDKLRRDGGIQFMRVGRGYRYKML